MSALRISFEKIKVNQTIARIEGEFAGQEVMEAQGTVVEAVEQMAGGEFVLDFEEVSYVDSAGVGLIFELAQAASGRKVALSIVNAKDPVKKVLKVTRVNEIVKIY